MKQLSCLLVVLFMATGCQAVMEKWQKSRILSGLKDLKTYHGTMIETGVTDAGDEMKTEFWYQAPDRYHLVTKAPARFKGSTLHFDGKTLITYYPQTKFAVVTTGFKPQPESAPADLVSAAFDNNVKHLDYWLGPSSRHAGYDVVELNFKARSEASVVKKGRSLIYDKFSFPLLTSMDFSGGSKYVAKVESIKFNDGTTLPAFSLPADTIKSEWDLDSETHTLAAASKELDSPVHLPSAKTLETPLGPLAMTKIIRQKGPVPAFAAIYDRGPLRLSVLTFRDYGVSLIPLGRGVKIPIGNVKADFFPNAHWNGISFKKDRLLYLVQGNVPLEVLVSTAKEIASAK